MKKNKILELLHTWIVPILLGMACILFFPILSWLTMIKRQPHRWFEINEALLIWSLPVITLSGIGIFIATKKERKILKIVYIILLSVALVLLLIIGGLSGASPKT